MYTPTSRYYAIETAKNVYTASDPAPSSVITGIPPTDRSIGDPW